MLSFLFRRKRENAKRILQRRANRTYMKQFNPGNRRSTRGAMCDVAWLLPFDRSIGKPVFDHVRSVVTRDICEEGLSFIHTEPVTDDTVVLALRDESEPTFLLCRLEHSTDLGYGFHLVGVQPIDSVFVEPDDASYIERMASAAVASPVATA